MRINNPLDGLCRRPSRPKCEQFLRLDIRALARRGFLRPGRHADLSIASHQARRSATIRLVVKGESIRLHYVCPSGSDKPLSICCHVRVERTSCRYGGTRPWFRCPRCRSRRAVLYGFASDGKFGCWGCMDVVYESQDARKMSRLWRRQAKLEAKLLDGYRKPKCMHWSTFMSVYKQLAAVRARQDRLFCDGGRALLRRRGWSS